MAEARKIVQLKAEDSPRVIEMMGRAFAADPLPRFFVPDDPEQRFTKAFISLPLKYCFGYGAVHTTPAIEGAACWLRPGEELSTVRMLRVGMIPMMIKLGWSGFQRMNKFIPVTEELHKEIMPKPHWYLWALGVEPALHRQGIASALMHPVLSRADADNVSCYLETMNEQNLPFYERLGFTVGRRIELADGAQKLTIWGMRRQAHH
ncbi:MAG: GNAT family N-acetyltransferase [Burkholderiales bacterium]|nr:GNAT family N-acetyltransferase [Anaerolineae bacterium]